MFVELFAPHPRLDGAVEILLVHLEDRVHLRQVDREAALDRGDVALERGAGAEGYDRYLGGDAQPDQRRHLFGRANEGDRIGQHRIEMGLARPMLEADRLPGAEPVADHRTNLVEEARGQRLAVEIGQGRGHGLSQYLKEARTP